MDTAHADIVAPSAASLASYRDLFPIARDHAFLNHCAVSPYSRPVTEALRRHGEEMQTVPFDRLRDEVAAMVEELKGRAADLIGAARADEVVPLPGTAMGINTAAAALPLRAGDNVLVLEGDYPANIYPWLNLAPRGVLVKWVPNVGGGLDPGRLEARIDRRTRVIALSSAMFASGFKNDLRLVGQLCRQRGIYFVVDAIQTLGAFPLDVRECNIDMLACGSQKWLLGVPGAGFFYCRHELLDELQPGAYVGAGSTVDPYNYLDYNFTPQPTSERFTLGTLNVPGLAALHAALGLLHEVGSARIAARILALTDLLVADLQRRGYGILSSLQPEHRSGIVIVDVDDPTAACARLLDARVVTSVRGPGLRIAPHFYNSDDDVLRVGAVLGDR